jgi:hypothetical protein
MTGTTTETVNATTNARGLLVGGLVLVLIGGSALLSELYPTVDRYIPLVIGIGLLALFGLGRWFLALVGGAIMSGLGIGLALAGLVRAANLDGAFAVLGLAGGFLGIWLISSLLSLREAHWWPLVPGSILLMVGGGLIVESSGKLLASWLLPLAILAIGVLVMVIGFIRQRRLRPTATG